MFLPSILEGLVAAYGPPRGRGRGAGAGVGGLAAVFACAAGLAGAAGGGAGSALPRPGELRAACLNVTSDGAQLATLVEEFFGGQPEGERLQQRFLAFLERKAALHLTLFEHVLDWVLGAYKFLLPFVLVRLLGVGRGKFPAAAAGAGAGAGAGVAGSLPLSSLSAGGSSSGSPTSVLEQDQGRGGSFGQLALTRRKSERGGGAAASGLWA